MATDVGKLQKIKNIIWPITWKRDAWKGSSQGSMIVSCEIMYSVNGCSKTIEMKMFVVNGTILQKKITPIECQNQNTFTTNKNWWISFNKSGNTTEPMRKRSDFNQALSTLHHLHREAGERQLRPTPYWKYQQRQPSSSSSSTWWQWSESWWSSWEFKESPVVNRSLAKNSDEWLSRVHSILWQMDRLHTADGGLL